MLALCAFASYYSSSIAYFCYSWKLSREDALLRIIPRPLGTLGLSELSSPQFSYYGVNFETPWGKVSSVQQRSSLVRLQFDEGQFVLLFDPIRRLNRVKVSSDIALAKGRDISEVYGRDVMKSNYAFLHAVLYLTPEQISLFSGWKRLVRDGIFLQLKHMEVVGAETGFYCFQLGRLKGFQKGDPHKSDIVTIDAFDDKDREYEVWVGKTKGTRGVITQEDVNAILSTIEVLPGVETPNEVRSPSAQHR